MILRHSQASLTGSISTWELFQTAYIDSYIVNTVKYYGLYFSNMFGLSPNKICQLGLNLCEITRHNKAPGLHMPMKTYNNIFYT